MSIDSMGKTIADLRKQKGVSQEEMSRYLGVTAQAISKWECGKNYPDIELLPTIADYFAVTIDSLFRV